MAFGRCVVAAVAVGFLFVVSIPPSGVWLASLAGLAILVHSLRGRTWAQRAAVGGTAGLVWFGFTLRWVEAFTGPGAVLLMLVQAAFPAGVAVLTPSARGRWVAFPGAVVLVEALRYRWPLGGLPLSSLVLGQAGGPLGPSVALVGPMGLLLLLAGAASLLALAATLPRRRAAAAGVAAVAVVAFPVLLPVAPGTRAAGPPLGVAAVQGGGPRGTTAVLAPPGEPGRVFERHLRVARDAGSGVSLLLWPEDTVDVRGEFAGSLPYERLAVLASALDTLVVAGVVEDVEGSSQQLRRFRNAAVAVGADGQIEARYDKVLRVPFGEYVPWRPIVDRIADLSLIPREAVPGTGPGLLSTVRGDLGVMISFEGLFPSRARAAVRAGAGLLLVPTNASSYATDDVPSQQLAAARLRAMETGRPVVMASPTGYSAVIAADGSVLARSELGAATTVRASVTPRTGATPYTASGDAPALVAGLGLVALGWRRAPKRRCVASTGCGQG